MKILTKLGIAIAFLTAFVACVKENNAPVVPHINHVDMVRQDSLLIWTIGFVDGDGDIGMEKTTDNDNKESLHLILYGRKGSSEFVKEESKGYLIDYIDNVNPNRALKGKLEVKIDYLDFIQIKYDEFYFEAYLEDRAGHISNTIKTPVMSTN